MMLCRASGKLHSLCSLSLEVGITHPCIGQHFILSYTKTLSPSLYICTPKATTVGLANTGNYLALPFLVITMWKLGFPETIMHIFAALYDKKATSVERLVHYIVGMGTIVHHSASALVSVK